MKTLTHLVRAILIVSLTNQLLFSQAKDSTLLEDSIVPNTQFFFAYDFGEAVVNRFQSLSGEIGLSLPNKHLIRMVHMNVWLTEPHLKSKFVATVKGDQVKGRMVGFETFYSLPVIKWREENEAIYVSPSVGFYANQYEHLKLNESFEKKSATLGLELSYRETNPFGVKGLYYTISIPMRTHFSPHDKTTLGDTTILSNRFDGNIWFFVGYQF